MIVADNTLISYVTIAAELIEEAAAVRCPISFEPGPKRTLKN